MNSDVYRRETRDPELMHSFSFADYYPCGVSALLYHPDHKMLIVGSTPQQGHYYHYSIIYSALFHDITAEVESIAIVFILCAFTIPITEQWLCVDYSPLNAVCDIYHWYYSCVLVIVCSLHVLKHLFSYYVNAL